MIGLGMILAFPSFALTQKDELPDVLFLQHSSVLTPSNKTLCLQYLKEQPLPSVMDNWHACPGSYNMTLARKKEVGRKEGSGSSRVL